MSNPKIEGMPDYLHDAIPREMLLQVYLAATKETNLGTDLVLMIDMEDPGNININTREVSQSREPLTRGFAQA